MYKNLPMAVFRGTLNILIFWLFLDNLSISEQTNDRALTIHTELYNYESMKKNNFIWFSPHTKTIHWL